MKPNWFVGLPVPAGAWFSHLSRHLPPGCRRFHPEDLHLTLAFLGPIDANLAPRLIKLLDLVSEPEFSCSVGPLILLPSNRRPTAICLTIGEGRDHCTGMINRYRPAFLEAVGVKPEVRPPLPHITIARPSRGLAEPARDHLALWAKSYPQEGQTLQIKNMALYTWSSDRPRRLFRRVHTKAFSSGGTT